MEENPFINFPLQRKNKTKQKKNIVFCIGYVTLDGHLACNLKTNLQCNAILGF